MEHLLAFVDFFIHLDKYLDATVIEYGALTYAILAVIIFCETGLVVTPVLPGDSLLFAAGAISSRGGLNIAILLPLLFFAAILGNTVNYHVGKFIGPKAFDHESRIFKRKYLERTKEFYAKYGGKTIIFAQFVPIVRTFAPFLAGVSGMSYLRFALYNVTGAALWQGLFLGGGHLFGNIEKVKNNFTLVIMVIIVISLMPAIIEAIRSRRVQSKPV